MNRLVIGFTTLALTGLLGGLAQAGPMLLAQDLPGSANNPYNSPIRRANPNSMQGTQPSAPALRGPNTVPVPRPATLENGGIGNGYPRSGSAPRSVEPGGRSGVPPRDPGTSNR